MPTPPTSDLTAETEAVKEIYAALNRNDIPGVFKFFDPEIERIEPPEFGPGRIYHGHADVKAHFIQGRETWAEGGCMLEQFFAAGDKVVVFVHVHVRLKNQQDWLEGRLADGFIFQDGKVIQMRTFVERQQALDWAGVKV